MGWEDRAGGRYYYRKRREGTRVVSEYVGRGLLAEQIACLEALEREQEEEARQQQKAARAALEAETADVRAVEEAVRTITHAALLASGYHTHKGQWRKRHAPKAE